MTTNPRVTIIMATFNRAGFIGEALRSIQAQTYDNWECVVVDDGSTDETPSIASSVAAADPRFSFHRRPASLPKGPSACRNMAMRSTTGDYILFVDDDDIVHPDLLAVCVSELHATGLDFCKYRKRPFPDGSDPGAFDPSRSYAKRAVSVNDIEDVVMNRTLGFAVCVVMWRRSCLERNPFDESLVYAEDWECYSRILLDGARGVAIDKVLYFNRMHANNRSNPTRIAAQVRATRILMEHLRRKQRLTPSLIDFFVSLSIRFDSRPLLTSIIESSGVGGFDKIGYRVRFYVDPIKNDLKKRLRKLRPAPSGMTAAASS